MDISSRVSVGLPEAQRAAASALLATAFDSDPLYRYLLPDRSHRARAMPLYFEKAIAVVDKAVDIVRVDHPLAGIAIVATPERRAALSKCLAQILEVVAPDTLSDFAARGLRDYVTWAAQMHVQLMPQPHWHLMLLAVSLPYQSQGIGSGLVRHVQTKATEAQMDCYVETQLQDNLHFYEHLGFERASSELEPITHVPLYALKWHASLSAK